jgi:hypothetical protein
MGHKVYISFKTEDEAYKTAIQAMEHLDYVDKSLNVAINSLNDDYILQKIRSDYLYDSTVTIFLIGNHSSQILGDHEQRYIKRELQASLYSSSLHSKNGILGIVLPDMHDEVFRGTETCWSCNGTHNLVSINDGTVIKEFSYNYYIPSGKCSWSEEDRYCVLASWDEFDADPSGWVDKAFEKRSAPIAAKTRVRP